MPGFLVHVGATVQCAHLPGRAQPTLPSLRVKINMGQQMVTQAFPYAVVGCSLPPVAGGPCVAAQFVSASTRLVSDGQAVLLADSQAVCAPTGTPLLIIATQTRVRGM
jgi:hypothetical protein